MNLEKYDNECGIIAKFDNDNKAIAEISNVSCDIYSGKSNPENDEVLIRKNNEVNASVYKTDTSKKYSNDFKQIDANENEFRLACLNTRSLFPKLDEVVNFVKTYNFSVFVVNESWLDESVGDLNIQIPGYNVVRRDRNRQGGGVCIYVMSNLKYTVLNGYGIDIESAWICVNIDSGKVVVGTVYRPPSADKLYDDSILNELEKITAMYENVILLGDLNIDCLKKGLSQTNFIGHLEDLFSMTQLVSEPTRETTTSVSLIDVILSTKPHLHSATNVLKVTMSDHYCVQTTLNMQMENNVKHKSLTFRNYKKFEIKRFLDDIKLVVHDLNEENDLQTLWEKFKKKFLETSNNHAPLVTRRLKNRVNQWMTHDVVKLMYRRDHVKQKAVKSKCQTKWNEYRKLRNQVTMQIRTEKNKYYLQQSKQCANNPKSVWKFLNKVINNKNMIPPPNDLLPDELNEYFSTIGEETANKYFERSNDQSYPWKGPNFTTGTFNFDEVDSDNVLKLIKALGDSSANDVLGFDGKLLFLSATLIAPLITKMFNMSLTNGIVIDDWKISNVTPVFKGGDDKYEKSNYRPISVISHIAKILEKLVQKQLVQYLIKNELLCTDQSAYRKFHNTQTSLHRCNEDWIDNLCDDVFTAVSFLDIRKCFDTIDHQILIDKLERYGIVKIEASWFKSYLENRSQYVKCNGKLSSKCYVPIGVPQGSVLGPVLFSLFVNDINCHVYPSAVNLYADDTLLYSVGNSCKEASDKLQMSLDEICKWYSGNRLALNENKSKCMLITSKHRTRLDDNQIDVNINGTNIEQVRTVKYLGVTIDENLTWNDHISALCKNLGFKISTLSRIKNMVTPEMLKTVYNSIIQPTIDYAITVWGHTSAENLSKIQRLQNKAARIICNNFDYINTRGIDLVKQLKWMNVNERFLYFERLLMFKCIHGMAPDYLTNNIVMDIEVRNVNTRTHDMNVYIPFPKNELAKRSFYYSGGKNWNDLRDNVKEVINIDGFKIKLKRNLSIT